MTENEQIKLQYDNECPDCGYVIEDSVMNGDECFNCGYVFFVGGDND